MIVVLSFNMFLGGIVRARKGWRKAGVLVSHFAILFMLVAGAVSSVYKEEGNMRVLQGEKSDYAQKLFKHDIEVFAFDEEGGREEPAIIRSKSIKALGKEGELEASFEKFDFKLEIDRYLPYSELALDSLTTQRPNNEEVVDGFFLVKVEKDTKTEERNMPGCYVSIKDENDDLIQRLVLWAGNPYPVTLIMRGNVTGSLI